MDDLSEKLGALLSSPDGMEKIKSVAAMFGAGGSSSDNASHEDSDGDQKGAETLSALISSFAPQAQSQGGSGLSGLDPSLLLKMAPILARLGSSGNDPRVHLLESLRPILGSERQESLEMAVTFLKISKLTDLLELL